MYTLSVYIAGEIDLFENLDIVHITLLVAAAALLSPANKSCEQVLKRIQPTIRRGVSQVIIFSGGTLGLVRRN